MRVLTMNIFGRRADWPARRRLLHETFARLDPDLVALQEAVVTDDHDQVADIVGDEMHLLHQRAREPGGPGDVEPGQGISIASRWPIEEAEEITLDVTPRTAGFASGAILAAIDVPAPIGPLLFVNHLPDWQLHHERERELQAARVAARIEELVAGRPRHVVLAGDQDADPAAASIRFWTGRRSLEGVSVCYRDAWESARPGEAGETFSPANPLLADPDWPFRRIDYVLVRCGEHGGPSLRIASCDLVLDRAEEGVWASDHFGLTAVLEPPAGRGPAWERCWRLP
jgi:endonuclease/exonuclease/phosphatase family metal-dependent hydrolase